MLEARTISSLSIKILTITFQILIFVKKGLILIRYIQAFKKANPASKLVNIVL